MEKKSKSHRALQIRFEQEFIKRGKESVQKEFENHCVKEIEKGVTDYPVRDSYYKMIGQNKPTISHRIYIDTMERFLFPDFYK